MTRTKKNIFRITTVVFSLLLVIGLLEVVIRAMHFWGYSRDVPLAEMRETLESLQIDEQLPLETKRRFPQWIGDHILHPFLGYVRNRSNPQQVLNRRLIDEPVNDHGFFGPSPIQPESPDRFVIAITGGSVACELYLDARETLRATLAENAAFSDKRIEFVSLALSGMKQPQQLLALEYFLVLGAKFDCVVNFDGFNDVVLPLAENEKFGVAAHSPRYWPVYATMGLRVDQASVLVEAARIQQRRRNWAGRVASPPWRYSHLALSLWHRCDNAWKAEIQDRQNRMREVIIGRAGQLSAQESGPPDGYDSLAELRDQVVQLWVYSSTRMARSCDANGIAYFHFLQPNQYFKGSKIFTAQERKEALGGPNYNYRRDAESGYPLLVRQAETLRQNGVNFHDLTMLFKNQSRTIYRDKCCHYNQTGYDLVAERIGTILAREWNKGDR